MKTNKLDTNIKKKLDNRTLEPSASAWERLSVQLDEQPQQKKKGWFFYIGVAASILLLVSIGMQLFSDNSKEILPKNEVVLEQINKDLIDEKLEQLKNEIPVEEAIVKTKIISTKTKKYRKNNKDIASVTNNITLKKEKLQNKKNTKEVIKKEPTISVAKVDEMKTNIISTDIEKSRFKNTLKQNPNSRIKINSNDLLFAVTHSPQEVKAYYAKYHINREDVLKTIQNQLKESNLKVNPETILAEVERTIDDEDFQNNFLKSLKRKVSDIATAIASRND